MGEFDGYGNTICDGAFTAGQVERDMRGQLTQDQIVSAARNMMADEVRSAQILLEEAREAAAAKKAA